MKLEVLAVLPALFVSVISSNYTCYHQKCGGTGRNSNTYVNCDQRYRHCSTDLHTGYPECQLGGSGAGVYCYGNYYCKHGTFDGRAHCRHYYVYIVPIIGGVIVLLFVNSLCCCCCGQNSENEKRRLFSQQKLEPARKVSFKTGT